MNAKKLAAELVGRNLTSIVSPQMMYHRGRIEFESLVVHCADEYFAVSLSFDPDVEGPEPRRSLQATAIPNPGPLPGILYFGLFSIEAVQAYTSLVDEPHEVPTLEDPDRILLTSSNGERVLFGCEPFMGPPYLYVWPEERTIAEALEGCRSMRMNVTVR